METLASEKMTASGVDAWKCIPLTRKMTAVKQRTLVPGCFGTWVPEVGVSCCVSCGSAFPCIGLCRGLHWLMQGPVLANAGKVAAVSAKKK